MAPPPDPASPAPETPGTPEPTAEDQRMAAARDDKVPWRRWGPYLSERQWGTVREDYSAYGSAWDYFPHDHARSRAYRWGEDGIAGICDDRQQLCFALTLWNGQDPILKERMFGLTGPEGNHGEDVKEYYFYLDNVPSHAYMKYLYKYPQRAYPYNDLVEENRRRGKLDPEYELLDTGIFDDDRYFDVFVEYAKAAPDDILIRVTATNRGPDAAPLHLLPTLWFKNVWSWYPASSQLLRPRIEYAPDDGRGVTVLKTTHRSLPSYALNCDAPDELLFTENDTNAERIFGRPNASPYVKDAFDNYIVHGKRDAVNPARFGTKAAAHYLRQVPAGESAVIRLRLRPAAIVDAPLADEFDATFGLRQREADAFYHRVTPFPLSDDMRNVQRQAFAGMLWSKQYYRYMVNRWLDGDKEGTPPPEERKKGRNHNWRHFAAGDVLSMPDKWEYPWFAAWDMAFHCVPLAMIDPEFAKDQLLLLMREWYMHPNGQIPAYEWAFGDVNPPVHAWAALRVYQIEQKMYGRRDRKFLERVFQKLLLNFTWWLNREDPDGNNIFGGGFLGLDNISPIDRSALPPGVRLAQADGTAWMALYALNMLVIARRLAEGNPVYDDMVVKFIEQYLMIVEAIEDTGLHDREDGWYYDRLEAPGGATQIRVQTLVGAIPLLPVAVLRIADAATARRLRHRFDRLAEKGLRGAESRHVHYNAAGDRIALSVVGPEELRRTLASLFDEDAFLSPHGLRSLSKRHAVPYEVPGHPEARIEYEPGEGRTAMYGGNSNWRGPVWMPLNILMIPALIRYHGFLGDEYTVEYPTGSGRQRTLAAIAQDLADRLISIWLPGPDGRRPVFGDIELLQSDPAWKGLLWFPEYFHGDTGAGLGAMHQTGWTAEVINLLLDTSAELAPG
jgi:hypothetical protein